jgi:hypothetical protein
MSLRDLPGRDGVFLMVLSFVLLGLRRLLKLWPVVWRLIDPKTPVPCPTCGKECEREAELWACRHCGEVW